MARLNNATDSYKLSNDEYVRRLSEITKSESANVIHRYGMTVQNSRVEQFIAGPVNDYHASVDYSRYPQRDTIDERYRREERIMLDITISKDEFDNLVAEVVSNHQWENRYRHISLNMVAREACATKFKGDIADCPELQEILTEFIITCKLHDIAIPDDIKNSVK
jgi:hypothetical protein